MSHSAVSCEHLAIEAHLLLVLSIHRTVNLFAAFHAAFKASIHRDQATALYASTNLGGCFLGLPVFMSMHTHCV